MTSIDKSTKNYSCTDKDSSEIIKQAILRDYPNASIFEYDESDKTAYMKFVHSSTMYLATMYTYSNLRVTYYKLEGVKEV